MKIVVLGDVSASDSNRKAFIDAESVLFSSEIQKICKEADAVLLNLEKPLTDVIHPLDKCPPDYFASIETINGIKLLHPTIVTLANNHIMDQREQGLFSTINVLIRNQIQYVGAGHNIEDASKPIILSREDFRIGVYACCEKEFSFATKTTAGANAFDPLRTFDEIEDLKKNCDYLIVLFHGGMQGYPYPTPYQQRVCRKMCENGADLVMCQHSHIIGCEEEYAGGRIVYGQGNFLLDDVADDSWLSGLITEVKIDKGNVLIEHIPVQTKDHRAILHPEPDRVLQEFRTRSKEIIDTETVNYLFEEHSEQKLSEYLLKLSGKSSLVQRIFRRLGITKHYSRLYSKSACNRILDYLYCDTHREAIEYGLNRYIQKKEKNESEK